MIFKSQASQIVKTRSELGFHAATWDKLPIRLIGILSEIDDVEAALRADLTSSGVLGLELSDVVLYTVSVLQDIYGDAWGCKNTHNRPLSKYNDPSILCAPIRKCTMRAYAEWRRDQKQGVQRSLEELLCSLANALDVNLLDYVELKLQENAKRSHLHGGKNPDS